ncbi:hypothetical protein [Mucilaginibacter gotjawali]|uniref:Uncharacterized protein n=2 Tax=Mucilaginibacter gotjawali TaxID=1550579 RepID=A0A839SFL8_9SPHI|nr:hypothetical protein [Mucilaginibacter gotjawali]MBB3056102.1 hypothetical protein [Mucilaginibacter gotjawali]BAU53561.1 hypothetical protein MgSA37_01730 [Mucilaginibacter gotjawali]
MRTSLNDIKLIDGHIFNSNQTEDALLFDALLILNPDLPDQVMWQKKTHSFVQQYSRKKLKAEIEAAHQILFNEPEHKSFRQRILNIFR